MKTFEAYIIPGGGVQVDFADGSGTLVLKADRHDGAAFALEYLEEMNRYYPEQIAAASALLERCMGGDRVEDIKRTDPNLYNVILAIQSLSCGFGKLDCTPDYTEAEGFVPEDSTGCPMAAFCPFNGLRRRRSDCPSGCNPRYGDFTHRQREFVDMLVHTDFSYATIAERMYVSVKTVEYHAHLAMEIVGVESRAGLKQKLQSRRIL